MSTAIEVRPQAEAIERVVIQGDLSKLSPEERVNYYRLVCESVGLNPLTKPFEYITLNGKLTLYARKDATDQLRQIHCVSVTIASREITEGCYVVTARASFPNGRADESIGAVTVENLKGENRANAMMKAETKAKRRVTLSICGLGMLDETEIETIPSAKAFVDVPRTTEPIQISGPVIETAADNSASSSVKGDAVPPKAAKAQEGALGVPPTRQPGEDDDVEQTIGIAQQKELHVAFGKAIRNDDARKTKDVWLQEWLKKEGYTDESGKGSTKAIPEYLYREVLSAAVKFAESLPQ